MKYSVEANTDEIISRLRKRLGVFNTKSSEMKKALIRMAIKLERDAKLNVRSPSGPRNKPLIDQGRLLNSIRSEVLSDGSGVVVGSFGVPYAAMYEFGFSGAVAIRAHERIQTTAFGQPIPPQIVGVRAHTRQVHVEARPYLGPALDKNREFLVNEVRRIYKNAK